MDQTTSSNTESSSSSSYEQQQQQNLKNTTKSTKPSFHHSLHSIRKPIGKPTTKHFIAPLPPTPLKIYKVEPSKFKEAVRELTSTPEFQFPSARRLKDKAPPPLVLSTVAKPSLSSNSPPSSPPHTGPSDGEGILSPISSFMMSTDFFSLWNETMQGSDHDDQLSSSIDGVDCFEGLISPVGLGLSQKGVAYDPFGGSPVSPAGFGLSPTSLSWCSSVLFSPAMNQSQIL